MNQQSLFPLTVRPTTRAIADAVRGVGAAALPSAERKADDARYQEVRCRSALNHVKGMPFEWTLNPYRGCTHGCHYCFARRYHKQFELDSDDEFASVILVKTNFVEVLARELARPKWERDLVAMGTATDPYQPIEGQYRLSRQSLVELAASRTPVSIVTKGPMVVRDIDVLKDVAAAAKCTVCMSVPSVDEDAWRQDGAGHGASVSAPQGGPRAHPGRHSRRRADGAAGAGHHHGAPRASTRRLPPSPIMARRSSAPTSFTSRAARAIISSGFSSARYPHLVDGYARLYANGAKRVPKAYSQAVQDYGCRGPRSGRHVEPRQIGRRPGGST